VYAFWKSLSCFGYLFEAFIFKGKFVEAANYSENKLSANEVERKNEIVYT
jgi:hypothetical protein